MLGLSRISTIMSTSLKKKVNCYLHIYRASKNGTTRANYAAFCPILAQKMAPLSHLWPEKRLFWPLISKALIGPRRGDRRAGIEMRDTHELPRRKGKYGVF